MFCKTLTILSLVGLLLSAGLWGMISFYATGILYLNANNWVRLYVGGLEYNYVYSDDPLLNPTPKFAYGDCKEWLKLEGRNNVLAWQSIGLLLAPHPKGSTPILLGPQRSPQVSRAMLSQGVHIDGVFIPHWIPSGLFAAMLALCLLPLGRRCRRKKLGLCVECGYDLRSSKERCPECGTATSEIRAKLEQCIKPTDPESPDVFIPFYAELDLLTSDADRLAVLKAAYSRLHRSRVFRIYLLLWAVIIFPLISVITRGLTLMLMNIVWLSATVAVVAVLGSLLLSYHVLFRNRVQAHLRDELVARRISLCLHCGYDLRGSVERCPECGKEFS